MSGKGVTCRHWLQTSPATLWFCNQQSAALLSAGGTHVSALAESLGSKQSHDYAFALLPCLRYSNRSRIRLTGPDLFGMSTSVAYTISITATSAFNATHTASTSITVAPAGKAPIISIVGLADRKDLIADGFKIATKLVPESVCDGAKVGEPARTADGQALAACLVGCS